MTNTIERLRSKINPKRYIPHTLTEMREIPEYGIEIFVGDGPNAMGYVGKSQYHSFFYKFANAEKMEAYLTNWVRNVTDNIQHKRDVKAKVKDLSKSLNASEHFKVGDYVVNTWGYGQTNVDFYKVIEILPKSIRVRQVYNKTVEGSEGYMSCNVVPSEEVMENKAPRLLKLKISYYNSNPEVAICNPESYYYFRKWSGKEQYCSWYH